MQKQTLTIIVLVIVATIAVAIYFSRTNISQPTDNAETAVYTGGIVDGENITDDYDSLKN